MICIICQRVINPERDDYRHQGSCPAPHHQCWPCALPLIRAGKFFCPACPPPVAARAPNTLGNLVTGADSEQNKLAAEALRAERKVSAMPTFTTPGGAYEIDTPPPSPLIIARA